MGYGLGVDIGTTWTAAAIARAGSEPQVLTLGGRTAAVPTVVHVLADRSVNVGDAAAATPPRCSSAASRGRRSR
jgi:molecular chaperone DnaK